MLVGLASGAQPKGWPPNDVEIHSAYCVGFLGEIPVVDPSRFPEVVRGQIARSNERVALSLDRHKSYMRTKDHLDSDAILSAVAEGGQRARANKQSGICSRDMQAAECVDYMAKLRRCRDADFLPY